MSHTEDIRTGVTERVAHRSAHQY